MQVSDKLGLSYSNPQQLNKLVDLLPSERPKFACEEIHVGGEAFEVYLRDVLECIRALYGDPAFARHLVFLPERHYADPDCTMRLYHDMHTGKWWWAAQVSVQAIQFCDAGLLSAHQRRLEHKKEGATIIPIILSSDKTQITLFRNKTAYPVYLTIGNLPKDIRSKPSQRGQILVAYLPTTKLEHIKNKAARRRTLANLFHACMRRILEPLVGAGGDGVDMVSGDGARRRCHPLLAAYVCDYPEQVLVTGVTSGECMVCKAKGNQLGDYGEMPPLRDVDEILPIHALADTSPTGFVRACTHAGIKPIYHPFWENLPHADIYLSITPDILHQLLQGVVKHLVNWVKAAYDPAEIDARCRRLPPNHNVRLFFKGITSLSRLTGREHADICRILLGVVIDLGLPDGRSPARLIKTIRALLDFVYLAQYPLHNDASLDALESALDEFHQNKSILVDLGIRANFNITKLHFLRHYRMLIERLGAADNFNTEFTERLHIDFAKDAYQSTNKKDEFPQMTLWLERREKILRHADYVVWRERGCPSISKVNPLHTQQQGHIHMTRHPSAKAVSFSRLQDDYGARDFQVELARYIIRTNDPMVTRGRLKSLASGYQFKFHAVPIYHKAKLWDSDFPLYRHASDEYDVIHVFPARPGKRGKTIPARFDTALVNTGKGSQIGVEGKPEIAYLDIVRYSPVHAGYRVAQIRAIFTLPKSQVAKLLPGRKVSPYLAYVEWFTPFRKGREVGTHGMYRISRALNDNGTRSAMVVELENIRRSIHLFPQFGPQVPREWSSEKVLEQATNFFVNSFTDRHVYGTVF